MFTLAAMMGYMDISSLLWSQLATDAKFSADVKHLLVF